MPKPLLSTKTLPQPSTLPALNASVVECTRCPRLRAWCESVAIEKRRAYRDHEYWGKPVPSFGDPDARVLLLGLAPGAHGSNRTGRPFTGDGSGNFLYPLLWEAGFASQPRATHRGDGMVLRDMLITSVARCAPPGNKPSRIELENCSVWLDAELNLLRRRRVTVALGRIAFDNFTAWLERTGRIEKRAHYSFSHGAEFALQDGSWLLATYHPSLQNTNTGRLTAPMLLRVLMRSRELAGLS